MELYLTISVFIAFYAFGEAFPAEPVCSSFDFQFKTLETMLRTEKNVEKLNEDTRSKHESIEEGLNKLQRKTAELELLKTEISDQKEKFNLLTARVEERLQGVAVTEMKNTDTTVAFSVVNPTKSLKNGVPTFKTTTTNIGGAYNMATGVFTSPVDGLYMFVFTVQSDGKHDVYCFIKHNGSDKAFARTYSDNTHTSASTSVYLLLTKGDIVTLGGCGNWDKVYNINTYDTAFSGVLIKQTSVN